MDPDPSVFIIELQEGNQKINLKKVFLHSYYFLKALSHHFSKVKHQKEVTKQQKSRLSGGSRIRNTD
jgi:hypothetical protein